MSRKILPWSIFSILSLLWAAETGNDEFLYLHTASFNFHDGVPFVRVHVADIPAPARVAGAFSASCGSQRSSGDAADVTVDGYGPAQVRYRVAVEELTKEQLSRYRDILEKTAAELGRPVELFSAGGLFSISDRRIDNREYYVALAGSFDLAAATAAQEKLREDLPARRILVIPVLVAPSKAMLTVAGPASRIYCDRFVRLTASGPLTVGSFSFPAKSVLFLYASAEGAVGLVAEEDVEKLLYRILPGEMFASAPMETLKAQAVAARSDIFMQLGKRHAADPFHICSEVHCQKLLWDGQKIPQKFVDAVNTTRGEILLYRDLYVARAPYSSSCGGHTESNRAVWFSAEQEYLTGVWDTDALLKLDMTRPTDVRKFLEGKDGECGIALNKRFRWERTFTDKRMDELLASYGVGRILELTPVERGSSGRVWKLLVGGEKGERTVYGELVMRRLLEDLPSSLFVIDHEKGVWRFKGAGWGHGVGMCQMGAVGLGQKGKKYREILSRYYPGTTVTKIY